MSIWRSFSIDNWRRPPPPCGCHISPFDGRGFILKGFVTKPSDGTTIRHTTLFHTNNGIIKNTTIKNATLGGDFLAESYHGLLVYSNTSDVTNYGLIENCVSYGNLIANNPSSKPLGLGVFAYNSTNSSIITYCVNNMNITLSGTGSTYLGGIVRDSFMTPTISNNINNGNLKATHDVGGIITYGNTSTTENAIIKENINYGNITGTVNADGRVGGIIGYLQTSVKTITTNNTNYGTITSNSPTRPACGIASGTAENTGFTHRAKQCNLILPLLYSTLAKFRSSSAFPTSRFKRAVPALPLTAEALY